MKFVHRCTNFTQICFIRETLSSWRPGERLNDRAKPQSRKGRARETDNTY